MRSDTHGWRSALAAVWVLLPILAWGAVPAISDNEEHVLRGFFDRQASAIALDKLALEKGSTLAVKQFAQSELDLYQALATGLAQLDDEFKLFVQPITPGASMSPKLGQGITRGVETLPAGASWASKNTANFLTGGPGAGMPPGGAPAGGAGAPRGPMMARYDYDLSALQQLSGPEFDHQYALRVAIAHNAMLRHVADELNEPGANAELVTYAKSALSQIAAQNSNIERLLLGQDLAGPGGPGGAGRPGSAAGAR